MAFAVAQIGISDTFGFFKMQSLRIFRRSWLAAIGLSMLGGCAKSPIPLPYLNGPEDFISDAAVVHVDRVDMAGALGPEQSVVQSRNNYIAEKMFIIDRNYSRYEAELSQQHDFSGFFGSLATIGLTSAGSVIPLGPTTKILSQTVLAVTSSRAAFDKDVLLAQTVQAVQAQMRTDRAKQYKVLLSRMRCSIEEYPLFLALSDLEEYRRAGTFESAQSNFTKAVASAEAAAEASKKTDVAPTAKTRKLQEALATIAKELAEQPSPCPVKPKG